MVLCGTTDRTVAAYDAPAKINLALHITGQRSDGYHLLDSIVVRASFGDRIFIERAALDRFSIVGPFATDLDDADPRKNLIVQARDALRLVTHEAFAVAITLEKNLPVASGVGGGSADAAATLRGLTQKWQSTITHQQMHDIALALGADVPMCLNSDPMRVEGIGDEISMLANAPILSLVAVNPGIGVATPIIFQSLTKKKNPSIALPIGGWLDATAFIDWLGGQTRNDLYAPAAAHCPAIDDVLGALCDNGSLLARMSGSGATCFGLFADDAAAQNAARTIKNRHKNWYVQAGQTLTAAPQSQ